MPRQINVTEQFQGRETGERPIKVGVYEEGDARLFGLEDYLVSEQGKAAWMGEAPQPLVVPQDDGFDETDLADDEPEAAEAADDGEEPDADEPFYSVLDELLDQFGATDASGLSAELLRGEVEARGLDHLVIPTGKNGNVLKSDLVRVLSEAEGTP